MDHLAVACVDYHMVNGAAVGIKYQIPRLQGIQFHPCSHVCLFICCTGKLDSEAFVNTLGEAGAVRSICQAGAASISVFFK